MQTPENFNNDFLVWTDDNPDNNFGFIRDYNKNKLNVIQLTSTKMT